MFRIQLVWCSKDAPRAHRWVQRFFFAQCWQWHMSFARNFWCCTCRNAHWVFQGPTIECYLFILCSSTWSMGWTYCGILCPTIVACYQGSSFGALYNDKVICTSIPKSVSPSFKVAWNRHRREGKCTNERVVFLEMGQCVELLMANLAFTRPFL